MLARICSFVCAGLKDNSVEVQSITCLWPEPHLQPELGRPQFETHLTCALDLMSDP